VSLSGEVGSLERAPPGRRPVWNLPLLVALVVALGLLAALALAVRRPAGGPQAGRPAPELVLETFDGPVVTLADLRGRVVVLNFWASWCRECEVEAADLEAIWRDYRDRGVTVLGIDYTDTRPAALAYLQRHGITYPNGRDRGDRISRAYRLTGVPETLVIDPQGLVVPLGTDPATGQGRAKIIGPIAPEAPFGPRDLRAVLDALLAGGS
jgi:cytochrome c biogenesis protein CcmG/thiol:disulfide interchange protein DsbE